MSDQPHIIRGGPIRARELREAIIEHGFERGVVNTLERFMDEYVAMRQQFRQMTELLDNCITQMSTFLAIGDGLRNRIEEMKRERDQSERTDYGQ